MSEFGTVGETAREFADSTELLNGIRGIMQLAGVLTPEQTTEEFYALERRLKIPPTIRTEVYVHAARNLEAQEQQIASETPEIRHNDTDNVIDLDSRRAA